MSQPGSRFPRTTHTWLKPLYDALDAVFGPVTPSGASGVANGIWMGAALPYVQLGNASGVIGLYGATGLAARLATGTAGITGVTGAGGNTGPSVWWFNGGSGAYYKIDDLVIALKNAGVLKP